MLLTHNWAWLMVGAEWLVAGTWLIANWNQPPAKPVRAWMLTQAVRFARVILESIQYVS